MREVSPGDIRADEPRLGRGKRLGPGTSADAESSSTVADVTRTLGNAAVGAIDPSSPPITSGPVTIAGSTVEGLDQPVDERDLGRLQAHGVPRPARTTPRGRSPGSAAAGRSAAATPSRTSFETAVAGSRSPSIAQAWTTLPPFWTIVPRAIGGDPSGWAAGAGRPTSSANSRRATASRSVVARRPARPSGSTSGPRPAWRRTARPDGREEPRARRRPCRAGGTGGCPRSAEGPSRNRSGAGRETPVAFARRRRDNDAAAMHLQPPGRDRRSGRHPRPAIVRADRTPKETAMPDFRCRRSIFRDIKLPDGLRDMNRQDIQNAISDRMPKRSRDARHRPLEGRPAEGRRRPPEQGREGHQQHGDAEGRQGSAARPEADRTRSCRSPRSSPSARCSPPPGG